MPTIQTGQLVSQILDPLKQGTNERIFAETFAIGKIYEYLEQKYDLRMEITATSSWEYGKIYYAGQRVIIDYDAWVPAGGNEGDVNYQIGNCVSKDGKGYVCMQPDFSHIFLPENWQILGDIGDIYFIDFPYPIFRIEPDEQQGAFVDGFYYVGDKVWWSNHIWTCKVQTQIISDAAYIQYQNTSAVPPPNVFPNLRQLGKDFWTDEGVYEITSIPSETELQNIPSYNSSVWVLGDNRNKILVKAIVDIVIYELHSRISPNNIPDLRTRLNDRTYKWLKDLKDGRINLDIEPLQPTQGNNLVWGSTPKYINKY